MRSELPDERPKKTKKYRELLGLQNRLDSQVQRLGKKSNPENHCLAPAHMVIP